MLLFEIESRDGALYSPYCFRARWALRLKSIGFESRRLRLGDKEALEFSGQDRVPVLVDGERVVCDSWNIAVHLDALPGPRLLPEDPRQRRMTRFVVTWIDRTLTYGTARLVLAGIARAQFPEDAAYFRKSREERFGQSLESIAAEAPARLPEWRQSWQPARELLGDDSYFGGAAPSFLDLAFASPLRTAAAVHDEELLEPGDPLRAWRDRLFDLLREEDADGAKRPC